MNRLLVNLMAWWILVKVIFAQALNSTGGHEHRLQPAHAGAAGPVDLIEVEGWLQVGPMGE